MFCACAVTVTTSPKSKTRPAFLNRFSIKSSSAHLSGRRKAKSNKEWALKIDCRRCFSQKREVQSRCSGVLAAMVAPTTHQLGPRPSAARVSQTTPHGGALEKPTRFPLRHKEDRIQF